MQKDELKQNVKSYAQKFEDGGLRLLKKGQKGQLYTYLNVGEGIIEWYGFATQTELKSFKLLIRESGGGGASRCRRTPP